MDNIIHPIFIMYDLSCGSCKEIIAIFKGYPIDEEFLKEIKDNNIEVEDYTYECSECNYEIILEYKIQEETIFLYKL